MKPSFTSVWVLTTYLIVQKIMYIIHICIVWERGFSCKEVIVDIILGCSETFLGVLFCTNIFFSRCWWFSHQVVSDSWDPMNCSLPGSSVHGKNTGVGYHLLLQGIFLTQESNPGLLHCWQILYQNLHFTGNYMMGCVY